MNGAEDAYSAAITATAEFISGSAIVILSVLSGLYVLQLVFAIYRGAELTLMTRSDNTIVRVRLWSHLRDYNHGLRDAWVFFVLAILLPVFLNSLSGLIPLIGLKERVLELARPQDRIGLTNDGIPEMSSSVRDLEVAVLSSVDRALEAVEPGGDTTHLEEIKASVETRMPDIRGRISSLQNIWVQVLEQRRREQSKELEGLSQRAEMLYPTWLYHLCLACIGVLITLEFSYVHTFRRSAPDWIPLLLAALVLDLITLLVLVFVVGNPADWRGAAPHKYTQLMYVVATCAALVSSFVILITARIAGLLFHELALTSNEDRNRRKGVIRRRTTLVFRRPKSSSGPGLS